MHHTVKALHFGGESKSYLKRKGCTKGVDKCYEKHCCDSEISFEKEIENLWLKCKML